MKLPATTPTFNIVSTWRYFSFTHLPAKIKDSFIELHGTNAHPAGFEPATHAFGEHCSAELSYGCVFGGPNRIWTRVKWVATTHLTARTSVLIWQSVSTSIEILICLSYIVFTRGLTEHTSLVGKDFLRSNVNFQVDCEVSLSITIVTEEWTTKFLFCILPHVFLLYLRRDSNPHA